MNPPATMMQPPAINMPPRKSTTRWKHRFHDDGFSETATVDRRGVLARNRSRNGDQRTRNRNGGIEAVVRGLPTTNTASQQQNDAAEEYLDNDEGEDIEDVNEDFEGAERRMRSTMMINREQWISKPRSPFG